MHIIPKPEFTLSRPPCPSYLFEQKRMRSTLMLMHTQLFISSSKTPQPTHCQISKTENPFEKVKKAPFHPHVSQQPLPYSSLPSLPHLNHVLHRYLPNVPLPHASTLPSTSPSTSTVRAPSCQLVFFLPRHHFVAA
jgi:hypothetical protein